MFAVASEHGVVVVVLDVAVSVCGFFLLLLEDKKEPTTKQI